MRTLFNSIAIASCVALSASADKAHDAFEANKDSILARPITVCGDVAFSVGRAKSPKGRGDAVGYAKAEEQAKWNLGEQYRAGAAWPADIQEDEEELAWAECRSQHPERFSVFGMQRIKTVKTPPDGYMVVMSFPADQVQVPKPTAEELRAALDLVRDRKRKAEEHAKRLAEEALKKQAEEPSRENQGRTNGVNRILHEDGKKHDNFDGNLML